MNRFAFAFAAALLISACGSEKTGTFETADGEGSYKIGSDGGEVTAMATTKDGTTTMRSGENVPLDLPNGFTLYPGAKVQTNTAVTNNDGKGALIIMESDASPEDMIAFYRKQAEAAGIKLELEMTTAQGAMIAGNGPNDLTFTFNANRPVGGADGKTNGQMTISQGMK